MSDIVAWLRERSTVFHLAYIGHELREAADEIERLRAELAAAKREYREGGQSRPVREWENLFGSAPNATGSLSSEAFVRKQRDDDWP